MDRRARDFIEVTRLAGEHFIRQPAEKYDRSDCRRETKQKRQTDELEQTLFLCGQNLDRIYGVVRYGRMMPYARSAAPATILIVFLNSAALSHWSLSCAMTIRSSSESMQMRT